MIYYISDLHIGHKAALRFDERPFADVKEMENEIILRWNQKVTAEDDVYILGDVFYGYKGKLADFLHQLNGRLHLITGNHDYGLLKDREASGLFAEIEKLKMIIDNGRYVVLCHYPLIDWNKKHFGAYHVYGHVHKKINDEILFMMKQKRAYNAGCMINGYVPCSLEELEQNNKYYQSGGNHKIVPNFIMTLYPSGTFFGNCSEACGFVRDNETESPLVITNISDIKPAVEKLMNKKLFPYCRAIVAVIQINSYFLSGTEYGCYNMERMTAEELLHELSYIIFHGVKRDF